MKTNGYKIGHGFDVHQLVSVDEFKKLYPSRKEPSLIIGGIKIPYDKLLIGHSDADLVVHAIVDALLGAAGLEDIGSYFPPGDKKYENINSLELLKEAQRLIKERGYSITNIDCTVMAEQPKMKPYILKMREKISEVLNIDLDQINIKATTTEKLGFIGREEGIAAEAVCLLLN